jgi:AIPR protein
LDYQTKNTSSFSSNSLIQMGNGLQWIFTRPRKDLALLGNKALRDKAYEVRSIVSNLGPSNVRVHVRFVTRGNPAEISDEFRQELNAIRKEFDNGTFEEFDLRACGVNDLMAMMKAQERATRRINGDLKIRYDVNTPSLIRYHSQNLKGLVCTISAQEIARLVNQDQTAAIFDLNLRRFLGSEGAVNKDILTTCTDVTSSYEFWFLNNGIAIVCDSCDPVTDPDDAHVKLKNMQIVNGCQTAASLAKAEREGKLAPDVRVLVRIYETADSDLVNRIVLTTNNQNRITSRDLRANDSVQLDMEKAFQIYGYYYERKTWQYHGQRIPAAKILANEFVGQCYLAVVLRNPGDARGRKYKIWGEHYEAVFSGARVEPHLIASLLGWQAHSWLRRSVYRQSQDDVTRILAKRGGFYVARIAAHLWRKGDEWNVAASELEEQLEALEKNEGHLDASFDQAFRKLEVVVRARMSCTRQTSTAP